MPSGAYPYNMDLHKDQLLQPVPVREFFRLSLLEDAQDTQLLAELDMHGEIRKPERDRH
ncbi:hypothetical protein KP509_20G059200 [Ceratopteris richardii]|uniref:Uncharacterized protein n=1 Tax=Ceratopteris richardii TaxID=49495 RepID=A0A8T2SHH6_CERRI|nr:hypothetical protein KP509_20G059200 [Ceratopteris richardii]